MSEEGAPRIVVSFFWLGFFAMLIACMLPNGYSCSCAGCDLVDSSPAIHQK